MIEGDPIRNVQMFIDERWAVAQPKFYPDTANGPRLQPEVTPSEAAYFMASLVARGTEPPLFSVNDERKLRSDRHPPLPDGMPRSFHFFEEPGRLRLETIVHMAAMARLHFDFGWPREHLVFESPTVTKHETEVLTDGALDILLLEAPCAELAGAKPTLNNDFRQQIASFFAGQQFQVEPGKKALEDLFPERTLP